MSAVSWKMIARVLRWGAAVGLIALMLIGWSLAFGYRNENDDLTTTQARQRPVTDYNQAFFVHLDCIKQYEIRFFGDISDIIRNSRSTDPAVQTRLAMNADRDRKDLALVFSTLCRPPSAPVFAQDGTLKNPAEVYPQLFPNPN